MVRPAVNKSRTFLLITIDKETKDYIKKSFTRINKKEPEKLAHQYDKEYVITFDNSLVNNNYINRSTSKQFKSDSSKRLSFPFSVIGSKNFIKERKIEVGSRKLLGLNMIKLTSCDELNLKNFCKSSKTLQRIRLLLNPKKDIRTNTFMTKKEKKNKIFHESVDYLMRTANLLKIIDSLDEDSVCDCENEVIDSPMFYKNGGGRECITPISTDDNCYFCPIVSSSNFPSCFQNCGQLNSTDIAITEKDESSCSSFFYDI